MRGNDPEQLVARNGVLQQQVDLYRRDVINLSGSLVDLVQVLSRLGHAANKEVLDSAVTLARNIRVNSHDTQAIQDAADAFLSGYKKAFESGAIQTHDSAQSTILKNRLMSGDELVEALSPVADWVQGTGHPSGIEPGICERLAELVLGLPLNEDDSLQVKKMCEQMHAGHADPIFIENALAKVSGFVGRAHACSVSRDADVQLLIRRLVDEFSAVESFLNNVSARDDESLAHAESVQSDMVKNADDLWAVLDEGATLVEVREQVLDRASAIRSQMHHYVEAAKEQRQRAANDTELMCARMTRDFLTGLHNRRMLEQTMSGWLAEAESSDDLCCVIWDIDYFKRVNDTHGHEFGDSVLCTVANALKDRVGSEDIAVRLGGEEFVTIIRNASPHQVLSWANETREVIGQLEHDTADGQAIGVSISCGIAHFMRSDTLQSIMARADKALYEAKNQGRNQCYASA